MRKAIRGVRQGNSQALALDGVTLPFFERHFEQHYSNL